MSANCPFSPIASNQLRMGAFSSMRQTLNSTSHNFATPSDTFSAGKRNFAQFSDGAVEMHQCIPFSAVPLRRMLRVLLPCCCTLATRWGSALSNNVG